MFRSVFSPVGGHLGCFHRLATVTVLLYKCLVEHTYFQSFRVYTRERNCWVTMVTSISKLKSWI